MSLNSCFYHSNLPAMLICFRCGRKICSSCSKSYNGMTLCPNCYHTVPAPASVAPVPVPTPPVGAFGSPPPPVGSTCVPVGTFGSGWYGPYGKAPLLVRSWWLPAALVAIAAGLIVANGIALLSPGFFATWSAFLPWLPAFGSFGFILGVVLGLVLVGAIIMVFLKFRILAAFVIFPTAILSFFIGGGFILGIILAVLGGILLLLK
ncbi:MAG: hypothetical protein ABSD49_08305 [Candidatus Bathyarchaeia archaeon]